MQTERAETMTQQELVEDLRLLGYRKPSVTRIAGWRKRGLLPRFSSAGAGQGRGPGREKCYWSNPGDVLKQAEAILRLLEHFTRLEELYVPLWQLGYPVPLDKVRSALQQPLLQAMADLEVQETGRSIEDVIDDAVWDIGLIMQGQFPLFDVPDDSMSAALNVLANTGYNFNDQPYEYGVTRLKEWEHSFADQFQKLLGDGVPINPEVVGDDNNIFRDAPFINQYLSLPQLLAAVQTCTDEDLTRVQHDLQIGREILQLGKQLFELLSAYLPASWRSLPNDLDVILNLGRIVIWVDLALRKQGFGYWLDQILPLLLEALRENFNETVTREIAAFGPEIGKALQAVEELMQQEIEGMNPTRVLP